MPRNAPSVKIAATESYGAELALYDPETTDRQELAYFIADQRDAVVVPPFDHPHVVAGQGTVAKELIEEVGSLDYLLVPCGGGGLLSGSAIAAAALSSDCKVVGVEPEAGNDATRSFKTKSLQHVTNPDTLADGARTSSLGQSNFPLVMHYVHDMLTVSDEELIRSMFYLWEWMKIVIEPTGALAAAALLGGAFKDRTGRIGVILSGGNVDLKMLAVLQARLNA